MKVAKNETKENYKNKKSDGFQVVYDNYNLREEMIWEWVCDKIEMWCEIHIISKMNKFYF